MKFNPLLKLELKKWNQDETIRDAKISQEVGNGTPGISGSGNPGDVHTFGKFVKGKSELFIFDRPKSIRGKIAGMGVSWKPVNKQAAMLIAKAPWWAYPPQMEAKPPDEKTIKKKAKPMSKITSRSLGGYAPPGVDPNATVIEEKSKSQVQSEVASEFVKLTAKTLDDTGALLSKALDARAAMDVMSEQWKVSWLEFQKSSDERLSQMRITRMAMDSEMRQLMSGLREVRQFFLDKDYETERARLQEFVGLCERLQTLKGSGFLDTVADTMLNLASK